MASTIKIYDPAAVGSNLKMAILSNYTFNKSHKLWSQISSYDIGKTGEYSAGGVALSSITAGNKLSVADFTLYLVNAANVSHLIIWNADNNKNLLAVEYDNRQNWNNSKVTYNWPDYIIIQTSSGKRKKSLAIEMER